MCTTRTRCAPLVSLSLSLSYVFVMLFAIHTLSPALNSFARASTHGTPDDHWDTTHWTAWGRWLVRRPDPAGLPTIGLFMSVTKTYNFLGIALFYLICPLPGALRQNPEL